MAQLKTDTLRPALAAEVDEAGFAIVRDAVEDVFLDALFEAVRGVILKSSVNSDYGMRGLLANSDVFYSLAAQPVLLNLARAVLGSEVRAVKGIYFDKNPAANWLVPWHQDLTITVRQRCETFGFGSWSVKDGLVHVQPPVDVMADIIALRIHLDNAEPENGALRVLPGTHRQGRILSADISTMVEKIAPVVCAARRGDVLLMRPLLLHSSPPCAKPNHRRVVHLEYSARDLPDGLAWGG